MKKSIQFRLFTSSIALAICVQLGMAQTFAPFAGAQERMAKQLSDQLRHAEAYPYWSNLASIAEEQGGSVTHVREALNTAIEIEEYEEALHWIEVLNSPRIDGLTVDDALLKIELLKLVGSHQLVPRALAEARIAFPDHEEINGLIENWPVIEAMFSDSIDAQVLRYRPNSTSEEYGAVPYRGGLAFITRGVSMGEGQDGWTNQPWTKVAFIPDTAVSEPELGEFDKLFNHDLFVGLKQSRHHDGHIAFSRDRQLMAVTQNQDVYDTLQNVFRSSLQIAFFERIIGGDWVGPKLFEHNNPSWSSGHAAFTPEGDMIFASNRPGGFGGVDLWRCKRRGSGWLDPENMGPVINTKGDEVFPFVMEDSTLFFASNGHPGIGGLDLYSWVPRSELVEHLPVPLNSSADDFSMFLESDGTGWLSSNRGDWQDRIYQVQVPTLEVEWQLLVTACDTRPIPGVEVEFVDKTIGVAYKEVTDSKGRVYFSPRFAHHLVATTQGNDSLHAFSQIVWPKADAPERIDTLILNWRNPQGEITVTDALGKPLPDAAVSFVKNDGTVAQVGLDDEGRYTWSTATTVNIQRFNVDALNRESETRSLASINGCARPESYRVSLELVEDEDVIDLGLILYDLNKASLRPESKAVLDQLVDFMIQRPLLQVELSSHTDCRNSDDYNLELSQRRAQSCVDYIISQGINAERIIAKGYGESMLLNECTDGVDCDESEHQKNRRTELRFVVD